MKTCEELLDRLLTHFYADMEEGIVWSYIEDTPLRDVDKELDLWLREYVKNKRNSIDSILNP